MTPKHKMTLQFVYLIVFVANVLIAMMLRQSDYESALCVTFAASVALILFVAITFRKAHIPRPTTVSSGDTTVYVTNGGKHGTARNAIIRYVRNGEEAYHGKRKYCPKSLLAEVDAFSLQVTEEIAAIFAGSDLFTDAPFPNWPSGLSNQKEFYESRWFKPGDQN